MRSHLVTGCAALTAALALLLAGTEHAAARSAPHSPTQIAAASTSQTKLLGDLDRLNGNVGKLSTARTSGRRSRAEKAAIADQNRLMRSFQKSFATEIVGLRHKLDTRLSGRQRTKVIADARAKVEQALRDLEKQQDKVREQRRKTKQQFEAANEKAARFRNMLSALMKTLSKMQQGATRNTK